MEVKQFEGVVSGLEGMVKGFEEHVLGLNKKLELALSRETLDWATLVDSEHVEPCKDYLCESILWGCLRR